VAAKRCPSSTSEYRLRYAPDVVWDRASLLEMLQVNDADAVGDVLDWPWDAELDQDGVDLRIGTPRNRVGLPVPAPGAGRSGD
jgi:hypothetical protein